MKLKKSCSGCKALRMDSRSVRCEMGKKIEQTLYDGVIIGGKPLELCEKLKTNSQYLQWKKYSQKEL